MRVPIIIVKEKHMDEYSLESLTTYQKRCLSILIEFDRVCIAHNIRYYLLYGTVLGAVRHNGFIPWDNDVDVGLSRKNYEKLLVLSDKFTSPYFFEYFQPRGTYVHTFAKVYDSSTTVVEPLKRPFRRGVWIDVFPLDGTFDNRILRYFHVQCINIIKGIFSRRMGRYIKIKKITLRSLAGLILIPISYLIPVKVTSWMLNKLTSLVDFDEASYVGGFVGVYGMKEVVPAECIRGVDKRISFCNILFPVPADPDRYLTLLYGDYMTPPPPEERVGHELQFVDLGTSFDEDRA